MRSWLALLSVLLVCALGARFLREPSLPVERVRAGVSQLWRVQDTDVTSQGGEMRVPVRFPRGARERQKRWTYDLVRWLAGKGRNVSVVDGTTGVAVPDVFRGRVEPTDKSYWEMVQSEKLQTYCQNDLNQRVGKQAALVLLEVEALGAQIDPTRVLSISRIHACLVVSSPDLVEEAQRGVRPALDGERGDDLRVLVIR